MIWELINWYFCRTSKTDFYHKYGFSDNLLMPQSCGESFVKPMTHHDSSKNHSVGPRKSSSHWKMYPALKNASLGFATVTLLSLFHSGPFSQLTPTTFILFLIIVTWRPYNYWKLLAAWDEAGDIDTLPSSLLLTLPATH